jgi:hypothetical protein
VNSNVAIREISAERPLLAAALEERTGAIKCEGGNVEVQWSNITHCLLDTMSDLVGKVDR